MRRVFSKFRHSVQLSTSSTPDPTPAPAVSATTGQVGSLQTITQFKSSASAPGPELSQATRGCNDPYLNASLENFPPEVRRHILSMLELEGLRALVYASPVYHQQYLLDRRRLLCQFLETTLCSVTIDACVVYQSSLVDFADVRTSEKAIQLLKSYQDRRFSSQYSALSEAFTMDQVLGMVAFHSSIIKQNSHDIIPAGRWTTSPKRARTRRVTSLQVEQRRSSQQPRLGFDSVDILKIFICIFEPWEVEEIACIYTFAKEKYSQIFDDIRWDVKRREPQVRWTTAAHPRGGI